MAKKPKIWLNNKLNKCLHFTVVMKFYRIFVTELVFSFFVVKYQNHFEFPKDGKRSLHLKILEIPGGRRSSKTPWNGKSWGVGGGVQIKESSVGEVGIFSGTTHCRFANRQFQKISIPIPQTAFRISEGEGGFTIMEF